MVFVVIVGLYRGSVIGGPRTLVTQISDNVTHRNSWSSKRKSLPGVLAMTLDPMKEESFEKKMATIAMSTHDPRMSRLHGKEDGPDDDEEWAKVSILMSDKRASFNSEGKYYWYYYAFKLPLESGSVLSSLFSP